MLRWRPILFVLLLLSAGCSTHHAVPPGTVPPEHEVSAEDEQYGHKVFGELSRKYPIDRDDAHVNRVRDVVDKLTTRGLGSKNPWHVYVLSSKTFKNAAATRGNYVIVWSGLLDALKDDDELATVLAHEIGHLLAGHTNADPMAEASKILGGATGTIAGAILGAYGIPTQVGDMLGQAVSATFEAMMFNPGQRSKELEADLIGMFLMAKAGIDPQHAVDFWSRVKLDPDFANDKMTFLTNHPSSKDRLKHLEKYLPQAEDLYHGKSSVGPKDRIQTVSGSIDPSGGFSLESQSTGAHDGNASKKRGSKKPANGTSIDDLDLGTVTAHPHTPGAWVAEEDHCDIYDAPRDDATVVGTIAKGSEIRIAQDQRAWLEIEAPQHGFVHSFQFSPEP